MTGSGLSLIAIPIVAMISLAVWLIMVYYANSHPLWKADHSTPEPENAEPAALAGPRRPDGQLQGDAVRIAGNRPDPDRESRQPALRP
jgi:hypothetical protein